jgi:hypothetical protein
MIPPTVPSSRNFMLKLKIRRFLPDSVDGFQLVGGAGMSFSFTSMVWLVPLLRAGEWENDLAPAATSPFGEDGEAWKRKPGNVIY